MLTGYVVPPFAHVARAFSTRGARVVYTWPMLFVYVTHALCIRGVAHAFCIHCTCILYTCHKRFVYVAHEFFFINGL